jgi:hypothetical protein
MRLYASEAEFWRFSTYVGDSHRGPLKETRENPLSFKKTKHKMNLQLQNTPKTTTAQR